MTTMGMSVLTSGANDNMGAVVTPPSYLWLGEAVLDVFCAGCYLKKGGGDLKQGEWIVLWQTRTGSIQMIGLELKLWPWRMKHVSW